jgi:protein-disulfide isomerase
MNTRRKKFSAAYKFYNTLFAGLIIISLALFYAPAHAGESISEEKIKELALEAILENPEIIEQALLRLEQLEQERQQDQMAAILTTRRDVLEQDSNAPVLGNPNGDVTIVEFFDYNCPFCRRVKPEISELMQRDQNVRLVYREWPILGPGSVYAARAALASREQGKYEEFHWALMALDGRADEQTVLKTAKSIGLDIEKLQENMDAPEIESHIALSMELANGLNITGTPTFIIGKSIAPGLVQADRLIEMVDQARSENQ